MTGRTAEVVRTIVELAGRAPSVHNTQPWRWVSTPEGSTSSQTPAVRGRERPDRSQPGDQLRRRAAPRPGRRRRAGMGHRGPPSPLRSRALPPRPGHLTPSAVPTEAADVLLSVRERCTDRRRFTTWPVSDALLHDLARTASTWGAHAVPVVDVTDRFRVRPAGGARARPPVARRPGAPRAAGVGGPQSRRRGPSAVLPNPTPPPRSPPRPVSARGSSPTRPPSSRPSDGVILLCGYDDGPADWLRTGEALSALWLRATLDGLSVVPLSQVVEVDETRAALQHEVLGGLAVPHLLVRLGWQALSRSHSRGRPGARSRTYSMARRPCPPSTSRDTTERTAHGNHTHGA